MQSAVPQEQQQSTSQLLALPDPCLLAVLRCLAAATDHRSLFSAARAHSSLRQAAVAALGSSITVREIKQQRLDGVVSYLGKHGQHVRSVELGGHWGARPSLRQLPTTMQLHSLELSSLIVQLGPGNGWQGVLGCAGIQALKQLRLSCCQLHDDEQGLPAALALLPPGLEHLSIDHVRHHFGEQHHHHHHHAAFPTSVLQQRLQQLTHLELLGVAMMGAGQASPALQPLQALSRLAHLRLSMADYSVLTASMLSGAAGLTRLVLQCPDFEPGVLAGKTRLQHLALYRFEARGTSDAAWTAQLLAHHKSLQQLTYLSFSSQAILPAAAYSALTASSKLRHLDIGGIPHGSTLPDGIWQHVFPAGRRLPHLTSLELAATKQQNGGHVAVPEGRRLASCCPGLRRLDVRRLAFSAGALASLRALSGLQTLLVFSTSPTDEALMEVCQLTALRELTLSAVHQREELLLQTTQLRQLTRL